MRLLRQLIGTVRLRRYGVRRIRNVVLDIPMRVEIGVDRTDGAWTLSVGESPAKRVCDLDREPGLTLLEFAEKFSLDAKQFATLDDAQRDDLLGSAVIRRTDQLLDRINDLLERRAHVPPPAMPVDSDGVAIRGWRA